MNTRAHKTEYKPSGRSVALGDLFVSGTASAVPRITESGGLYLWQSFLWLAPGAKPCFSVLLTGTAEAVP
jgi:hypothetical protein